MLGETELMIKPNSSLIMSYHLQICLRGTHFGAPLPVSYTHLDVYKRQAGAVAVVLVWHFALENLLSLLPRIGEFVGKYGPFTNLYGFITNYPVSYTHLDVYKRQSFGIDQHQR